MQFVQDAKKVSLCIGVLAGSAMLGLSAWTIFQKCQKSIDSTTCGMKIVDTMSRKKQKLSVTEDDDDEDVLVPILLPGGAIAFKPRSQAGDREIVFSKPSTQASGNDDRPIPQSSSMKQNIGDERTNMVEDTREKRQFNFSDDEDEEGGKKPSKVDEESALGGPKFSPALYKQRYSLVCSEIEEARGAGGRTLTSLVDFGCADLKFLQKAKNWLKYLERLIGVDVDRDLIEMNQHTLNPLLCEYLMKRPTPLEVSLYCGSVADCDPRLRGVHVCTLIEIIEHLHDDVLEKVPQTVFGFIKPKMVIITTPNSEYNVLFPDMPAGEFRHWDHKFEWTRKQFQEWCDAIVERYPAYKVKYTGVGQPPEDCPPEVAHVGFCSQAAIFSLTQESVTGSCPVGGSGDGGVATEDGECPYSLVHEVQYPWQEPPPWEALMEAEVHYCMGLVVNRPRSRRSDTRDNLTHGDEEPHVDDTDGFHRVGLEELLRQPRLTRLCDNDIGRLREYFRQEMPERLSEDGSTVWWPVDMPPSSDSDEYSDEPLQGDQQCDFDNPPTEDWDAKPQDPSPPLVDTLSQRDDETGHDCVTDINDVKNDPSGSNDSKDESRMSAASEQNGTGDGNVAGNDMNNSPARRNDLNMSQEDDDGDGHDSDDQEDEYFDDDISAFTNDSFIGDESF